MKVKVYVEGGGDGKDLRTKCRSGFRSFFEKAELVGRMPKVIACGDRAKAFEKFCIALHAKTDQEFIILLVDSEGPVAPGSGPWQHLKRRDNWNKPRGATDEHAHLMVQCMEAWFLADNETLAAYFGQKFNRNALPQHQEIEEVAKADMFAGLKNATRQSGKGEYGKGRHAFDILKRIDTARVRDASPHANRLVETLHEKAG